MKRFDGKSAIAGFLVGMAVVSTAFAAGSGIQSAVYNTTKVTLDGTAVPLKEALVSVTKDGDSRASNYMPLRDLLEYLGYTVEWDGTANTVNLTSPKGSTTAPSEKGSFTLTNSGGMIAQSGSFEAKSGQKLVLTITADIKGSTVDFFLVDPNGKESYVPLNKDREITFTDLTAGTWAYNCFGKFDSGSIKIVGTLK